MRKSIFKNRTQKTILLGVPHCRDKLVNTQNMWAYIRIGHIGFWIRSTVPLSVLYVTNILTRLVKNTHYPAASHSDPGQMESCRGGQGKVADFNEHKNHLGCLDTVHLKESEHIRLLRAQLIRRAKKTKIQLERKKDCLELYNT